MFKLMILMTLMVGASAHAANFLSDVECVNDQTTFKLVHQGNPRNGATAHIAELQGTFPFGGVWLWKISSEGGYLSSQTKFKTMNGGVLTVSEQVLMGRGGCGRGSCDNHFKIISAYFIAPNSEEYLYDCNKISI